MERTTIVNLMKKEELKKVIASSSHSVVIIYKNGSWGIEGEHRKESNIDKVYSLKCDTRYSELELLNIIEWLDHILCITSDYSEEFFPFDYQLVIGSESEPLEDFLRNPLPTIKLNTEWLPGFLWVEWNHGLKLFRLFKSETSYIRFSNLHALTVYLYKCISFIEDLDFYKCQCSNIRKLYDQITRTSLISKESTHITVKENLIFSADELRRAMDLSKHPTISEIYEYLGFFSSIPFWGDEIKVKPHDVNRFSVTGLIELNKFNDYFERLYEEHETFDEIFVRQYIRLTAQTCKRKNEPWINWRSAVEWNYACEFLEHNHYLIAMDEIIKAEIEILNMAPCFDSNYLSEILIPFVNECGLIKLTDILSYFNWNLPSNQDIANVYFSEGLVTDDSLYDFMGFISLDEIIDIALNNSSV